MTERLRGERPSALTRREEEVLALVAEGLTNREIAAQLGTVEKTIEAHLSHIRDRIGSVQSNRARLVRFAIAYMATKTEAGR